MTIILITRIMNGQMLKTNYYSYMVMIKIRQLDASFSSQRSTFDHRRAHGICHEK
jgi:hypothetical protein